MNRRLTTILALAFVVAAVCSYLVYKVAGNQMRTKAQPSMTRVLAAARNLEIGTLIKDADLTTAEWVGPVPKGTLVAKEAAIGRGVVSELYQGEPIVENRLAPAGSGGGLAATIPPGMRACAVRVDDVVGVAGFAVPGMRVDVLVNGIGPGAPASDGAKVRTLLQNIKVLSAGTNIQKDNEGKPVQVQVVNLLVTPEQGELLSLASNQTKIQLVLRNPLDTETAKTPAIAMGRLFSDGNPAPTAKPVVYKKPPDKPTPPHLFTVEVFNGGKRTQEKFGGSGTQATSNAAPANP
jgi:pilus assembly protein CpaB